MTQETALKILKTGRSAFITGSAGSGKTHLIKKYIEWLREKNIPVGITASTGIAATHMNGITIHAWCGIGIKDSMTSHEIDALAQKSYLKSRIKKTEVLIIDEVSMLHDYRLDLVDKVIRRIKQDPRPFGGMQVILSGDFFQLPPISRAQRGSQQEEMFIDMDKNSEFVYHSRAWRELDPAVCYLHEQHRQNDTEFTKLLNAIRTRSVDTNMRSLLQSRISKEDTLLTNSSHTKLYARNVSVDAINSRELNSLDQKEYAYYMSEDGPDALTGILKNSCLAPECLLLKENAKVMFVKNNYDEGYVNGTQGVVKSCDHDSIIVETLAGDTIEVKPMPWTIEDDGNVKAKIVQYPLRLAWAITIHKSQGMSLDAAEIDLSDSFEKGMGYVALSRVRSLEGLYLKGISERAFELHDEAFTYDTKWQKISEDLAQEVDDIGQEKLHELENDFVARTSMAEKAKKKDTKEITLELLLSGMTIDEIASERKLTTGTIFDHVEELRENDPSINIHHLKSSLSNAKFKSIWSAFQKVGIVEGKRPLRPVMEELKNKHTFDELRLVRLFM